MEELKDKKDLELHGNGKDGYYEHYHPKYQHTHPLQMWISRYLKTKNYSKNTIEAYKRTLDLYARYKAYLSIEGRAPAQVADIPRDIDLSSATVETDALEITDFFTMIQDERHLKPTSMRQYETALSSFYRYLTDLEIVNTNPMNRVERPKLKDREIKYLHHKEVKGMRVSEAAALRAEDLDHEAQAIRIRGKLRTRRESTENAEASMNLHNPPRAVDDTPTSGSGPFDQKQYDKLIHCVQEGLSEWNNWVAGLASGEINLREAPLANLNLKRIKLLSAHLEGAKLEGADLKGAKLKGAKLIDADLRWADLEEAILKDADLSGAYLIDADLEGAKLEEANLSEADLSEAILEGTITRNAKLLGTKCCMASVDGQTMITADCEINDKTDFTGVGLSGARVDLELQARLLRNIRKIQRERKCAGKTLLESLVMRVIWGISDHKQVIGGLIALLR